MSISHETVDYGWWVLIKTSNDLLFRTGQISMFSGFFDAFVPCSSIAILELFSTSLCFHYSCLYALINHLWSHTCIVWELGLHYEHPFTLGVCCQVGKGYSPLSVNEYWIYKTSVICINLDVSTSSFESHLHRGRIHHTSRADGPFLQRQLEYSTLGYRRHWTSPTTSSRTPSLRFSLRAAT